MLKRCFKCGQNKPRGEFYKHPMMKDGLLGKCRECTRADVIANRKKRIDYYRAYDQGRANQPERVHSRRAYATSEIGRARQRRSSKEWTERNVDKRKAEYAVSNAVRAGRLVKEPCCVCGTTARVQGHHEDYSKPLEVLWLCPKHHAARHKQIRAERKATRSTEAA